MFEQPEPVMVKTESTADDSDECAQPTMPLPSSQATGDEESSC